MATRARGAQRSAEAQPLRSTGTASGSPLVTLGARLLGRGWGRARCWRLVVLAAVATIAGVFAVIDAPHPARAGSVEPANHRQHVIVVGVPGLLWSDVSRASTPTLARLAENGSVGTLSARSAPSVTCPGEGWLTLGAGTYAAQLDPDKLDAADGCRNRQAPEIRQTGAGAKVEQMPNLRHLNDDLRFGAKPGSLGAEVSCTSAVGPGGALGAADNSGAISAYQAQLPSDLGRFFARCPLTIVDGGAIPEGEARAAELRKMDERLGQVVRHQPRDSVVMVVGVSETEADQPRLHVAVASGPRFHGGWLHSPSTRRTPYVQLADVAPTVLQLLGRNVPDEMAGRPWDGEARGRPARLGETVRRLVDTNTQAVAQRGVLPAFFIGLGAVLLLALAAVVILLTRRGRGKGVSEVALRVAGWVAFALAAVPAATFLANLVPWWRSSIPILSIVVAVAIAAAIVVAVAALAGVVDPLGNRMRTRVIVLAGVTLAVFFIDGVTGCWLQIDSLLGYNPLVAGRFVGFGNIAFSVMAAAATLLAAFLAHGQRRVVALTIVTVIALPTIAIDGLPQWGADFGGILTLVPAFVVLALLAAQLRVTWRRVALSVAAGAALVLSVGWLDYLRPPESRSHFGRFIQSMVDGSEFVTIQRKLATSLDLLFMGPQTIAGFVLIVLLVIAVFRPPPALQRAYDQLPVLRVALVATVTLALIGAATNDSGISIPLVMALVTGPITVACCAWLAIRPPNRPVSGSAGAGGASNGGSDLDAPMPQVTRRA